MSNTPQELIKAASNQYNLAALSLVKAARLLATADNSLTAPIVNTKAMIGDLVISTVELDELSKQYAEDTNGTPEQQAD